MNGLLVWLARKVAGDIQTNPNPKGNRRRDKATVKRAFKARQMKVIVAITGASGAAYGRRLLEELKKLKVETHLIVSEAGTMVVQHELGTSKKEIERLASHAYDVNDLSGPLVSGSFPADAMIVIPCSMKTLAGITSGFSTNLILRAADVALKEKRKLILVPRETPLSVVHLRNMLQLAKQGVIILPAMPGFYHHPKTIESLVDFVVGRVMDTLGIETDLYERWKG